MAKQKGMDVHVDAYAAQGAFTRMCGHKAVRVLFDLRADAAPYSAKGELHMPPPLPTMSKHELNMWWGKGLHLVKHNTKRGEEGETVLKNAELEEGSIHEIVTTLMEDTVVDSVDAGRYLGEDETSSLWAAQKFKEQVNSTRMKKMLWEQTELDEQAIIAGTSLLADSFVRQKYQADMVGLYAEISNNPALHPEIKHRFERSLDEGWIDSLISMQEEDKSASDLYDWVRDWFKAIHKLPPPPPQGGGGGESDEEGPPEEADSCEACAAGEKPEDGSGQEGEAGEKGQDSDPTEGDGEGGKPKQAKYDSQGNPSKGKGSKKSDGPMQHTCGKPSADKKGDPKEKSRIVQQVFEEYERDTHTPLDINEQTARSGDMQLSYGYRSSEYLPTPANRIRIIDYHRKIVTDGTGNKVAERFSSWESDNTETYKGKDSLAAEVKRYIQSETRTRVLRNTKKGKLDSKKLYKMGVPDAGQDWQSRVFWQRDHKLTVKETVVSLLIDISGSMSGRKVDAAIHCMDLVGDVCNTLGMDYEMSGFTTTWNDGVIHAVYKPFGARTQRKIIASRMHGSTEHMSGNADGENVLIAYHRLLQQKAKRRVLIVLSDGQPAGGGGDCSWYLRQVTQGIEQARLVDLHGIGIMSDAVKHYYSSHSILKEPKQLEVALLTVLKNNVLRLK